MWVHRTKYGRIVYNRPKHPFKWADVARILRDLEPPRIDELHEIASILQIIALSDMALGSVGWSAVETVLLTPSRLPLRTIFTQFMNGLANRVRAISGRLR